MKIHWLDRNFALVSKPNKTHSLAINSIFKDELALSLNEKSLQEQMAQFLQKNSVPSAQFDFFSRLDYETSGIIAGHFSQHPHKTSANKATEPLYKCYLAQITGILPIQGFFQICTPILPANEKGTKVTIPAPNSLNTHHQPSQKSLKKTLIIKLNPPQPDNTNSSWVLALISKGARHQIRAHLNYIGFPIINDPLYGKVTQPGPMQLFSYALYTPARGFFAISDVDVQVRQDQP